MQPSTFKTSLVSLVILLIIAPSVTSRVYMQAGEASSSEGTYRAMVYKQTEARIQQFNELYSEYYTSGHNQFSDYTVKQFAAMFLGGGMSEKGSSLRTAVEGPSFDQKNSLRSEEQNQRNAKFQDLKANAGYLNDVIPTVFSVDYTSANTMFTTSVKNQGGCGSCWAFAGIGELESYFLKYHQVQLDLSEQQMVDCLPIFQSGNKGCGGGFLDSVGSYASANGISQEKAYPYTAAQGTCNLDRINAGPTFSINSYVYIYDCVALANALLTLKPIGVCGDIDAQWQSYVSGVIPNCNSTYLGGHCVLLVGATSDGTSNVNNNYWKIKNSWGKTFGEAGFMRLYRDSTDILSGFCKICTEGIYSV